MSCCEASSIVSEGACKGCGSKGVQVAVSTVKALMNATGLRHGLPQAPRFCADASCNVVYFDDVSERSVTEDELVVRVYAKHPDEPSVSVCYCFNYTMAMVRDARTMKVSDDVRAEVEAGHCACELKNPKGACCLGDIMNIERGQV